MSALARPRGPLPARVYWVRRALVLGTAFLLIFGLARLLSDGSDGNDSPKATAEQAAGEQSTQPSETSTSTSTSTSTETGPAPGVTTKPRKKKTRTPLPAPTGECNPQDVTIEPQLERVAWSNRINIPFFLSGTDEACTFQVSGDSVVIKITSGSDLIWTSQQCGRFEAEDVVVRSATTTKVVLQWNGRRSDDGCTRTADFAKPGWYHVESAAFGGEPTSDKFELTKPKPVKVYKTVKPKPGKKNKPRGEKPDRPSRNAEPSDGPSPSDGSSPSGAVEPNG